MNVRAISCRFAARRLTLKASGLLFDHAALLPDRASAVTLVHAVPATPPACSRKCSSSRGTWPTCSMTSAITMNSVLDEHVEQYVARDPATTAARRSVPHIQLQPTSH